MKPFLFPQFIIHRKVAEWMSITFTPDNLLHLVLVGANNSGRKTLVDALIHHVFDEVMPLTKKLGSYSLKIGNNVVDIEYVYTSHSYEINLYEYGLYDRNIITDFIQEFIHYKTIDKKQCFIILHHFDRIHLEAQFALRRIIETCSTHFKFILLAESPSNIDKPLLSRFMRIQVPEADPAEIEQYVRTTVTDASKIPLILEGSKDSTATVNLFRLDLILELYRATHGEILCPNNQALSKVFTSVYQWIESPLLRSMAECRGMLYQLVLLHIPLSEVFKTIVHHYTLLDHPALSLLKKRDLIQHASLIQSKMAQIEHDIIGVEYLMLKIKRMLME